MIYFSYSAQSKLLTWFLDTLISFTRIMRFFNPLPSGKKKSFFSVKIDRQNIRPANLDYNPSVIFASYFFQSFSSRISPKSPRFFRHNLSNKQFFISICNAKTPFPARWHYILITAKFISLTLKTASSSHILQKLLLQRGSLTPALIISPISSHCFSSTLIICNI